MDITQLKSICTFQKEEILVNFVEPINQLFQQFEINTPIRQSFYLANVVHECGEFKWLKELGDGKKYEGRLDLGNTQSGDGPLFVGRGVLQTTGRLNYQKLSDYFQQDFINHPELLEQPIWAVLSSGFFWKNRNLNSFCDQNDFLGVTFRINGGFNGLQQRLSYLKRCFKAFNPPNFDSVLNDIYTKIGQNINLPKTNYYKTALSKAIPDQNSLENLKISVSKI